MILTRSPQFPPIPISLSALTARLPCLGAFTVAPVTEWGASRELEGTVCVFACMCSGLSAPGPGPGPAELVAAALLRLVCFGCDIFQLICLLFLLHVLSLLASGASLSGRNSP